MAIIVGERRQHRVAISQPLGQKVNREWQPVHLGEKCRDESDEKTHGPPFDAAFWFDEAQRKK